jgi:hypothetical protein
MPQAIPLILYRYFASGENSDVTLKTHIFITSSKELELIKLRVLYLTLNTLTFSYAILEDRGYGSHHRTQRYLWDLSSPPDAVVHIAKAAVGEIVFQRSNSTLTARRTNTSLKHMGNEVCPEWKRQFWKRPPVRRKW